MTRPIRVVTEKPVKKVNPTWLQNHVSEVLIALVVFLALLLLSSTFASAHTDSRSLNDFIVSQGGHDLYKKEVETYTMCAYGVCRQVKDGEAAQGLTHDAGIRAYCARISPDSYSIQETCVKMEEKARDNLNK